MPDDTQPHAPRPSTPKPPPLAQQRLARKGASKPGEARGPRPASGSVIADVAVGPNLRVKDNAFQAIFILASIVLAAAIGAFVATGDVGPGLGAILGGIVGLIAGTLLSGGILMVYRLFRH